MPTYYVDASASGADDGSSQTDAWTTIQRAVDGTGGMQPTAGDTVLIKTGTYTITATIDFDGLDGTRTSPLIFKGVNGSWVDDGTRAKITTSTNSIDGITLNGQDHIQLHNIEIESTAGTPGDGVQLAGATNGWSFVNCYIHGWVNGVDSTGSQLLDNACFIGCEVSGNSGTGILRPDSLQAFFFCNIHDNDEGVFSVRTLVAYGCIFRDNTNEGIQQTSATTFLAHCIFHGNANGIENDRDSYFVGCRITSNTTADIVDGDGVTSRFPFLYSYSSDAAPSGAYQNITFKGSTTSVFSGSDTDDGYENSAVNNYNLASGASVRNSEQAIDATNSIFVSAGLTIDGAGTAGGGLLYHPGMSGGMRG